ncbi:pentatricopeptide repeat-containing protein At2g13600-like [Curcuma longa]|uniref:pentatricopeptide repeat-containing protein At2g13600-like n=1 Tax=Curcuma longa TaxID=136217 RepID=UPI003D9F8582
MYNPLLKHAAKLHASLLKSGFQSHAYRCNLLLRAYVRCGALVHARSLLLHMPLPNAVSFNTLLAGYVRCDRIDDALNLFDQIPCADAHSWNTIASGLVRAHRSREALACFSTMTRRHVRPDDFTYSTILACCDLRAGWQLHAQMTKAASFSADPFVGTNLMKMYADSGEMIHARKVFDEMGVRDLAAWNVLMDCYSRLGMGELCLKTFVEVIRDGIRVDEFTLATVLNELADHLWVSEGKQLHSLMTKGGFFTDCFCCNALLNLYSKEDIDSALKMFDEMHDRSAVSWTIIISGLLASGKTITAFKALNSMRMAGVEPNSHTFGSLIGCCGDVGAYDNGKQYHGLAMKKGLELDIIVGSSIVTMYSKCGETTGALRLFRSLPEKDIVSWNGVICGFAQNGGAAKALQLFDELVQLHHKEVMPDNVTFVGVLTACSHAGLIHKGCSIFNDMFEAYSCEPQAEHYACMVDLFARRGLLEEAEAVILALPKAPNINLWGALLAACKRQKNLVMAKRISEQLYVSEPLNSSNYVLLANLYAENKEWDEAMKVRNKILTVGVQKAVGRSWIDIRGQPYSFASGDTHIAQFELISRVLETLGLMMLDEERPNR